MNVIKGLHHVTAGAEGAQDDVDFFTKVLGQRLIKQTVLFDGTNPVYHLYYAADPAEPVGACMTTFPWGKIGVYARKGTGQVTRTSYGVPPGSLEFWVERFNALGVAHEAPTERFGQRFVSFEHPGGLGFELIEDAVDGRRPWVTSDISEDAAIRGIHSVTLSLRETAECARFMTEGFGFRRTGEDGAHTRFEVQAGGAGRIVDLLEEPDVPAGSWTYGAGTVHHVAFEIEDEDVQQTFKDHLEGLGYTDVSERKDRNYFRSIYVRAPGGVLFEAAVTVGFAIDEPADQLGQHLMLPPRFESRRDDLLARLEPITVESSSSRG